MKVQSRARETLLTALCHLRASRQLQCRPGSGDIKHIQEKPEKKKTCKHISGTCPPVRLIQTFRWDGRTRALTKLLPQVYQCPPFLPLVERKPWNPGVWTPPPLAPDPPPDPPNPRVPPRKGPPRGGFDPPKPPLKKLCTILRDPRRIVQKTGGGVPLYKRLEMNLFARVQNAMGEIYRENGVYQTERPLELHVFVTELCKIKVACL